MIERSIGTKAVFPQADACRAVLRLSETLRSFFEVVYFACVVETRTPRGKGNHRRQNRAQ
jgi:hypothetical protein